MRRRAPWTAVNQGRPSPFHTAAVSLLDTEKLAMATLPRPTLEHTASPPAVWSVTVPPGKSRFDHAIAQEELALELDQRAQLEVDRVGELVTFDDGERVAATNDLGRDGEEHLVDQTCREERGVQRWAALAHDPPHAAPRQVVHGFRHRADAANLDRGCVNVNDTI